MTSKWDAYRPRQINGKRVASSEYRCWQAMKNRCLNKNCQDYRQYGGRGITLCEHWRAFDDFMDDMGPQPFKGATLERARNNEGYEPDNCEWATRKTQSRNRRGVLKLRGYTTWELAEQCGVKFMTIHHRVWKAKRGDLPIGRVFAAEKRNHVVGRRRYL